MDIRESFGRADWLETQKANELEELIDDASEALETIILLEAEITRAYKSDNSLFQVLVDQCKILKNYVKRSNRYLEKAQDERAETSVQGRMSLNELYRRRNNADRRIKEIEDRNNDPERGKIIDFTAHRNRKLAAQEAAQQGPGAA